MTTTTPSKEKAAPLVELPVDLRDYFAAKAMQALILASADEQSRRYMQKIGAEESRNGFADAAYMQADAMLKARQS